MIPVTTYISLLRAFVEGRLSPAEFEEFFLHLFKNDPGGHERHLYETLQALFGEVDAYCADAELRATTLDGIGDDELVEAATVALAVLTAPTGR